MSKTYRFVIKGTLSGANEYIKICRANKIKANEHKQNEEIWLGYSIPRELHNLNLERVKIKFIWAEKNRRRDPDNIRFGAKFILDALQKVRVIKQDNQNCIAGLEDIFIIDSKNPHIEVIIEDIKGE